MRLAQSSPLCWKRNIQLQEEEKAELFIFMWRMGLGYTNPYLWFKLMREAGKTLAQFHLFTHFQGKQNQQYCDHITSVLTWKQSCTYKHCYEKKQWDSSSDHKNHTESTVLLHVVMLSRAHTQSEHDTSSSIYKHMWKSRF